MKSVFLSLFIFLLSGCFSYFTHERRYSVLHKEYSSNREIILEDIVICSVRKDNIDETEEFGYLPEDSLLRVFKSSIRSIDTPITIRSNIKNYCDSSYYENPWFMLKEIDDDEVLRIAKNNENEIRMVPFISRLNYFYSSSHFGSVATIYTDYYFSEYILILIYLVEGDEIIYSKKMYYRKKTKVNHEEALSSYEDPTTQEHWDILAGKIMEDYIKRLEN